MSLESDFEAFRRVVGRILLASLPFAAAGCSTVGHGTYVVRTGATTDCRTACASLVGQMANADTRLGEVEECADGLYADPLPAADAGVYVEDGGVPVAVCRMKTYYLGGIGRAPEGLA